VAGGHHGGAWKIAYADFVTAMMAFFLLMWLLGSTAKGDLNGIAEYFKTPLKVSMQGGAGSGDSSSVIKGGGTDLSRKAGQVKKGETVREKKSYNLEAAKAELEKIEAEKLKLLKGRLEAEIDANPTLKQFKRQLLLDITTEGLRIQIVDEQNRPMFNLAGAELQPYTKVILREIGKVLNDVQNRVSLSGHTDATPYANAGRGYSNWNSRLIVPTLRGVNWSRVAWMKARCCGWWGWHRPSRSIRRRHSTRSIAASASSS